MKSTSACKWSTVMADTIAIFCTGVLAWCCGCSEHKKKDVYIPDGKLRDAVLGIMGKTFDSRYTACSWQCQTNGVLDIESRNFTGTELPMFGNATIHITPTSRRCYRLESGLFLEHEHTNEFESMMQEIEKIARLSPVTNTQDRGIDTRYWAGVHDDGLKVDFLRQDMFLETGSNEELLVWCHMTVEDTNLQAVAFHESQALTYRADGLTLAGMTTGKKVDVADASWLESGDHFRLWGIANAFYGYACKNSLANASLLSNTLYMIVAETETTPNTATNICDRILRDYEKMHFPNRFICKQSSTNEVVWQMPFFKENGTKEDCCQQIFVTLSGKQSGVCVYDTDVAMRLKHEYKIYKAKKRESELAEESKRFKIEDLFGVGLGWYQLEEEKLDSKSVEVGDDGEIEYCNNCLNPNDNKRYFGIGLTGYAVKKKSRRVCTLCADSSSMSKESAKRKSKEIADDLSARIGVAGECTIKEDDWFWDWDWIDADEHPMRIRLYADDRGYGQYKLELFINDLQLRNVKSYDEFVAPSGIALGVRGALDHLGCAVATEPNKVEDAQLQYDVLPIRKGLYLAELPIRSVTLDTNGCAVAVSYAATNEMTDVEIKKTLKTVRLFVENSLWMVGSEDHFRFGSQKGITSYCWMLDSYKPKGKLAVFLHGGKSTICPPIGLDIYWIGESHPEQKEAYADVRSSDLFASTRQSIVFISGKKTTGSGFIVRKGGKCYAYTNRHVVDNGSVAVKDIQGNALKVVGREDAIGLDISRLELQDMRNGLEFSLAMPSIGDSVTVIGDSDGVGAATKLDGKVIAVGPKVLEVDAKFIPGNSGSPVLRSDGKVIGIATFGYDGYNPSDRYRSGTRFNGVRRFALRIPEEIKWRTVW